MSLDAGSVYATLGGRFSPAGFKAFGTAMRTAKGEMDAAERAIVSSQKRTQASTLALGSAAQKIAGGGILALTAAVGASVKKAADLEQTLNVFQATTKATGAEMSRVRATAKALGADLSLPATSAKDAADAMTELAKGGLNVTQTMKAAKGVLQLSAAAQISNAEAATIVADNLNAFSLKGQEATRVADLLAASANATTATIPQMALALQQSASSAAQLGIPIEDLVTMLGELANAGIKGSDAGTSVKTMLQALTPNSKEAAAEMKRLGVEAFNSEGRFKGARAVIEDYRKALKGKTQEEKANALETIFGADAQRAASIILGKGATAYDTLKRSVTEAGAAAKLAEAQTKGQKGAVEGLKSAVETAAISVGEKFLPMVTSGLRDITAFVSAQDYDAIGNDLADGFSTAAEVLGNVADVGLDVGRVLSDIGSALDLGDADKITAIVAGLAGFKVASAVAPGVASLAGSLSNLALNARTAPNLAGFIGSLGISPVTGAAVAVGALAAGLVALASSQSTAEQAAARHRAELERLNDAADKFNGAIRTDVETGQRKKGLEADRDRVNREIRDVKSGPLTGGDRERALNDLYRNRRDILVDLSRVTQEYNDARSATQAEGARVRGEAESNLARSADETRKATEELEKLNTEQDRGLISGFKVEAQRKKLAEATRVETENLKAYTQAQNVTSESIQKISRDRIRAGEQPISLGNAEGVKALEASIRAVRREGEKVPKQVRTRLLLDGDQNALSKLGKLAAAMQAAGQSRVVARILTNADSASSAVLAFQAILKGVKPSTVAKIVATTSGKAEVDALKSAIAGVNNKNVTLTMTTIRRERVEGASPSQAPSGPTRTPDSVEQDAAGRTSGRAADALVGEGGGPEWRVNPRTGEVEKITGAQFRRLSADDWIIPTESRYRARARGLFAQLVDGNPAVGMLGAIARDIGVSAFAGGKGGSKKKTKPKKKADRLIPAETLIFRASPDDLDQVANNATQRLEEAKSKAEQKGKNGKLTKEAIKAKGQLSRLRAEARRRREVARAAKRYADQITAEDERTEIARNDMVLADRANDDAGFARAKTSRLQHMRRARGLLLQALENAPKGSAWRRALEKRLGDADVAIGDAAKEMTEEQQDAAGAETEADRLADTGMTDAERARLADIEKEISLAALTEGTKDDSDRATELQGFLEGVLGQFTSGARTGTPDVIKDLADRVKQARDNVLSLTGAGKNDNPDLQAQVDQQRRRAEVAEESSRINAAALGALRGPNDIGIGNGAQVIFQTLVPPNQQQAQEAAGYVVDGLAGQSVRRKNTRILGV